MAATGIRRRQPPCRPARESSKTATRPEKGLLLKESSLSGASLQGTNVRDGSPTILRRHLNRVRGHVLLSARNDLKHLIVGEVKSMVRKERRWRGKPAHGDRAVTLAGPPVAGLAVNLIDQRARAAVLVCRRPCDGTFGRKLECLTVGEVGVRTEGFVGDGAHHLWHGFPIPTIRIVAQTEIRGHQRAQQGQQKQIDLHTAISCSRSSTRMA